MSRAHRQLSRRKWERVRRAILERDGYRCARCGRAARLAVHHVRPLSEGGDPYNPENLETVCPACHAEAHARERSPAAARWLALRDALRNL